MRRAEACSIEIVRSSRDRPTNELIHLNRAMKRFLKPVRNVRWTNSHISQPMKPETRTPLKSTTALKRAMLAMLPRSRYLNGLLSAPFSTRCAIVRAAWMPDCIATSATPGSLFSDIMSPIAKTSGWPGSEQSGSTSMRPARSVTAPVAAGSGDGHRRPLRGGAPLEPRHLDRAEDGGARRGRVGDGFEPRREGRVRVVSEVRARRSRGHDQRVILELERWPDRPLRGDHFA